MGLALRDDDPAPSARRPLRFLTAGSVDDGKSTLIGRLLLDGRAILADQLDALEAKAGGGQPIDLALLTDGLEAEREQGITIDVAYRYFATRERKFIIADAPGHEQYTRNMVTAAAGSDAAVVLVDATKLDLEPPSLAARRAASAPAADAPPCPARASCCACRTSSSRSTSSTPSPTRAAAFARVRAALVAFAAEAGLRAGRHRADLGAARRQRQPAERARRLRRPDACWRCSSNCPTTTSRRAALRLLPVQYVGADAGSGAGHRPRVLWGRVARGEVSVGADARGVPERREPRASPSCTSPARASTRSARAARPASSSIASSTSRAATGSRRPTASRRRHAFAPRSPGSTPSRR